MASAVALYCDLDAILIQHYSPFRDHQFHVSRRHEIGLRVGETDQGMTQNIRGDNVNVNRKAVVAAPLCGASQPSDIRQLLDLSKPVMNKTTAATALNPQAS